MSALELWYLLRRRWWVIALVAVVAAATALVYSLAQSPTYRAQTEMVVLPSRADWGLSMYLEARMRTFRAVLLSFPQTEEGLPDDLADRLHVRLVPEEGRIVIEVDDGSPERAARLANALAAMLATWVDEFNATQVGIDRIYVRTLSSAEPPGAPSRPRKKLNTLAGAVLGAALGLPLAFLWDWLDDTLADPARASSRLAIPVWRTRLSLSGDRVPPLQDPDGDTAAAFHRLYTQLRFAQPRDRPAEQRPWRTLAVVAAKREDLPAALLAGLGAVISQGGSSALLVDADLGQGTLHEPFGLPPAPGLGDFLQKEDAGSAGPQETGQAGLRLLPAGERLSPAAQAAALRRAAKALPSLAQESEVVLIRIPSLLEAPEGLFLVAQADAVLLVGRTGRTRGRQIRRVLEALGKTEAAILGLALWR
jgi:capsular polysaccharide biosynthesis protein/Mrp family chromosome partitioning ATPase